MTRRQSADPLERYDTPPWMTRALIRRAGVQRGWKVIEPMAGCGAMAGVLVEAGCQVAAFDIEPRADGIAQIDTMTPGFFEQIAVTHGRDLAIITNPPFSLAADLARRALRFVRVALLVRITWLEMTRDRCDIPDPDLVLVLPRPTFIGKGSDSATCVWACWGEWAQSGVVRLSREDCAQYLPPIGAAPLALRGEQSTRKDMA